jgi:HlyD family secretion protein
MRRLFIVLTGLTLVSGEGVWFACGAGNAESGGRAATASQGAPLKKMTATGTIEPEEVVDVGVQMSGRIASFGADPRAKGKPIDYGSQVEAGTVLAQIDNALYAVRVEQERAGVMRAEAELKQAMIGLEHAAILWQVAQNLKKNQAISDADLEQARFNHAMAEPSVAAAKATLLQNKAALRRAEIELGYTTIKSPIKGVVIDRRANVGQIVGPAANAGLFLVAKMETLQVWASVSEADVARVRPHQRVRFTVDAYPGKVFEGTVKQIRLNATMTQNVVTYTVVVAVSSPTDKLLPYLTASVEFE